MDIFGADTNEYRRYQVPSFWNNYAVTFGIGPSPEEWAKEYQRAVTEAAAKLCTAIEMLRETLDDLGESPAGQALRAYEGLDLHPEIARAEGKLYRDGHYANAVEDAVKALNALVRMRSGVEHLDGSTLMEHVFSPKNPVLRFNALADESDRMSRRAT